MWRKRGGISTERTPYTVGRGEVAGWFPAAMLLPLRSPPPIECGLPLAIEGSAPPVYVEGASAVVGIPTVCVRGGGSAVVPPPPQFVCGRGAVRGWGDGKGAIRWAPDEQ